MNGDYMQITLELLKKGRSVRVKPQGLSMYPLLDGKNDSVVVTPAGDDLSKGDLVLYLNDMGQMTVHRIIDIDENKITMLGDGNIEKEQITKDSIFGKVTEITRNNKTFSTDSKHYLTYVRIWNKIKKIRKPLVTFIHFLKNDTYSEELIK